MLINLYTYFVEGARSIQEYVKKTFPWYRQVEAFHGKNIASGRSSITSDLNKQIPCTFTEV